MKTIILALLLVCSSAMSATFYIDYAGGSDAAAGTATGTAWKHHPYMVGFTGSYSHTAGDRFIFKGGVTWPRTNFQMLITVGGSSGSVRDYYGVDASWFTGGAWARPIFDFENQIIGNGSTGAGVAVYNCNNVIFDNIEFIRLRSAPSPNDYLTFSFLALVASRVAVLNCLVRDWDITSPIVSGNDGAASGGIGCASGTELVVSNCVVHQSGVTNKVGCAIYGFPSVWFNSVYDTGNAYIGGGGDCTVHDNNFYNLKTCTDPIAHGNAILLQGRGDVWNNLVHDIPAGITGIFMDCAFADNSQVTNLVYNNVVYHCGQVTAFDNGGNSSTNTGYRIYNNTLESDNSGYCIRTVTRLNGDSTVRWLGYLDIQNNHLITAGAIAVCVNTNSSECGPVFTLISANNLTQTVASAISAGYTTNNNLAPMSVGASTVNIGSSMTNYFTSSKNGVNRTLNWDIGAYEFGGTPLNAVTVSGRVDFSGRLTITR